MRERCCPMCRQNNAQRGTRQRVPRSAWRGPAVRLPILALLTVLVLTGCGRVGIAYHASEFLILNHAQGYIDLTPIQRERWDPRLKDILARHRAEALPEVAALVENLRRASQDGFPPERMVCLNGALRHLYRLHAALAIDLAAPLLADLTPTQLAALGKRFQRDDEKAWRRLAGKDPARERRERSDRYLKFVTDWIGELSPAQRLLVTEAAHAIPHSQAGVVKYRAVQRERLLNLLRNGADEAAVAAFLTGWLIEFRDTPPELAESWTRAETQVRVLFTRLGATLDDRQRQRLDERLRRLRNDLKRLLRNPELPAAFC